MIGAIAVVLVLGGLIFFHELGHFLAARILRMGVKTFSLGFGPKLFSFKYGRTNYQVACLPLGGYVSLVGEETKDEIPEGFSPRDSFALRPAWQRFIVIIAGSVFNLLLAVLIYWGLFWSGGLFTNEPVTGEIQAETPAARAGMHSGDRVLSINGVSIRTWQDISPTIQKLGGAPLVFDLQRDGAPLSLTIIPESRPSQINPKEKIWIVGILPALTKLPFFSAAKYGLEETWHMIVLTGSGFGKLIQRSASLKEVAGPVGIAQMISRQSDHGIGSVLALAALISINLGILNLLPIPVLDGGHALFLVLEMIFRRPIPRRVQDVTTKVGLVLLLCLMVLALYNDIMRIINNAT